MKGISPITLLLVLLALPALGWLWWTSDETDAPVAAVSRNGIVPAPNDSAEAAPAIERPLPPIEAFSEMVDRPLFAASRRSRVTNTEPADEPVADVAPPPEDNISDRYRLIGTVEEGGRVFALLSGDNGSFVRLRRGDRLENWTVDAINRQRVLMVNGDKATELKLVPEGPR